MAKSRKEGKVLTDLGVQRLGVPNEGRDDYYDKGCRGLFLRITAHGARTWYGSYALRGKMVQEKLGHYPAMSLEDARKAATASRSSAGNGIDPREIKAEQQKAQETQRAQRGDDVIRNRFGGVLGRYLDAKKRKGRKVAEIERVLQTYFGAWADKDIRELKRTDIEARLQEIADRKVVGENKRRYGGPAAREGALRQIRAMLRWHETNERDRTGYVAPILRGLTEKTQQDMERDHFLNDPEIVALWDATSNWTDWQADGAMFAGIVRLLLLGGQRRTEIAHMQRPEIDEHGVWRLPRDRNKIRDQHALPLTARMQEIIAAQPVFKDSKSKDAPWVFTNTGTSGFTGYSKGKILLDKAILAAMKKRAQERGEDPALVLWRPWRLHDLRRTFATIAQRVNVNGVHLERTLGHKVAGIEGVYRKHDFLPEKATVLAAVEAEILRIVGEALSNVVQIAEAKRRRKKKA